MDSNTDGFSRWPTTGGYAVSGNLSVSTYESATKLNLDDRCEGFQFFFNTIIVGSICIFGIVGNTVSIFVLQRDRYNRVPIFLLQSLAIADNSLLFLALIALSIIYGLIPVINPDILPKIAPSIYSYLNPLGYMAQSCAIWMTVLLALNRYAAVCRPFTSRRWLTMTVARIQVIVVVSFSVLLNLPRFFDKEIQNISTESGGGILHSNWTTSNYTITTTSTSTTHSDTYWYFKIVYVNAFYTSVVLILPLLLLFGFNVPLMKQLQQSKRQMIRNSIAYSGEQENNITVVMVIIIVEMIVCHAPDRIFQVFAFFIDEPARQCPSWLYYAMNICNFLIMLNSSTDFIVYYVFRKRFRAIICNRLNCRRSKLDFLKWNSRSDLGNSPLVRMNSKRDSCCQQGIENGQCIQQRTDV